MFAVCVTIVSLQGNIWDGKITITSQASQPAKVLHNGDTRHLGVVVHYFRFVD